MRTMLARLVAWLPKRGEAGLTGPIPLAAGSMLSQEWLAPHVIRLPTIPMHPRSTDDA